MKGVCQHRGEMHLHRSPAEFDFHCDNRVRRGLDDNERSIHALEGVKGNGPTHRASASV